MPTTKKGMSMSKAVAKRIPTPKPVVVRQVCDVCDEDWAKHPANPTVMDCLEILKAKNASHHCSHYCWHYHYTYPYQVTYTSPVWIGNDTITTSPNIAISPTAMSNNTMDVATAQSLAQLFALKA